MLNWKEAVLPYIKVTTTWRDWGQKRNSSDRRVHVPALRADRSCVRGKRELSCVRVSQGTHTDDSLLILSVASGSLSSVWQQFWDAYWQWRHTVCKCSGVRFTVHSLWRHIRYTNSGIRYGTCTDSDVRFSIQWREIRCTYLQWRHFRYTGNESRQVLCT